MFWRVRDSGAALPSARPCAAEGGSAGLVGIGVRVDAAPHQDAITAPAADVVKASQTSARNSWGSVPWYLVDDGLDRRRGRHHRRRCRVTSLAEGGNEAIWRLVRSCRVRDEVKGKRLVWIDGDRSASAGPDSIRHGIRRSLPVSRRALNHQPGDHVAQRRRLACPRRPRDSKSPSRVIDGLKPIRRGTVWVCALLRPFSRTHRDEL